MPQNQVLKLRQLLRLVRTKFARSQHHSRVKIPRLRHPLDLEGLTLGLGLTLLLLRHEQLLFPSAPHHRRPNAWLQLILTQRRAVIATRAWRPPSLNLPRAWILLVLARLPTHLLTTSTARLPVQKAALMARAVEAGAALAV